MTRTYRSDEPIPMIPTEAGARDANVVGWTKNQGNGHGPGRRRDLISDMEYQNERLKKHDPPLPATAKQREFLAKHSDLSSAAIAAMSRQDATAAIRRITRVWSEGKHSIPKLEHTAPSALSVA